MVAGALSETMKMIKIEHSVFALPFALVSAFLAAKGLPAWRILALILVAMVAARSAAMAFNRLIDAEIDARNPRTASRSIPAGRLTKTYAIGFTLVCILIFELTTLALNKLAFMLSPLILLVLLGYSLTKRFTSMCHFVLGLALGLSPFGAWVAVTGQADWIPVWLGLAVLSWTAGFDLIYACQDIDFDRGQNLKSIPATLGVGGSLWLARALHIIMLSILTWFGLSLGLNLFYWLGLAAVTATLIYEHSLVWGNRLDRVNMAFFTMNGIVSLVFGAATIVSIVTAN